MRIGRVEIVAWAVEMRGQQKDCIETVLLAVCLGLNEEHLLRQTVWRVGFLRISIPEIVLFEWHGRELGIRADRPDCHDLLYANSASRLEHVDAHHKIVMKEAARVCSVSSDTANHGRQMDHNIWTKLSHQCSHLFGMDEVVLSAADSDDVPIAPFREHGEYMPTEEAASARHKDAWLVGGGDFKCHPHVLLSSAEACGCWQCKRATWRVDRQNFWMRRSLD
jgi:hypothetical protein